MKTAAIVLITLAMVMLCTVAGVNAYGPAVGGSDFAPMFQGYIGVLLPALWVFVASLVGYAFRVVIEG